jgi:septal ring factor EnvC (AmiA/AmiB activator)
MSEPTTHAIIVSLLQESKRCEDTTNDQPTERYHRLACPAVIRQLATSLLDHQARVAELENALLATNAEADHLRKRLHQEAAARKNAEERERKIKGSYQVTLAEVIRLRSNMHRTNAAFELTAQTAA